MKMSITYYKFYTNSSKIRVNEKPPSLKKITRGVFCYWAAAYPESFAVPRIPYL
jgi:hypothetical protein